MYKLCKIEQSSKRQREIEGVLLNLMLEKRYEDISVSEICERANMPRKSFYRYFDGKDGAMQSLLYHTMMELDVLRISQNSAERTLKDDFEDFFVFWKGKKDFLEAFDRSGLIGLLMESVMNNAMDKFDEIGKYISETNLDENRTTLLFIVSGLMTMTINWYRTEFAESVPNMSRIATKIITRPLFGNLSRSE